MLTRQLNGVFDGSVPSRPLGRLTDVRRGPAHANPALELPRPKGRAIGSSSGWRAVLEAARWVASTETTVCLTGTSGTGREAAGSSGPRLCVRLRKYGLAT
jgi:hypothetical protein